MINFSEIKKKLFNFFRKKFSKDGVLDTNYETKDFPKLLTRVNYLANHKLGYPVSLLTYCGLIDNKILGIKNKTLANVLLNNVGDPFKDSETSLLEVKKHEREVIAILEKYFGVEKDKLRGYVTTGGTEGNFAGIWWSKRYLISCLMDKLTTYDNKTKAYLKQEQEITAALLKIDDRAYEARLSSLQKLVQIKDEIVANKNIVQQMLTPTVYFTKHHTHYSIGKIAEILRLNIRPVTGNDDGSINLNALQKEILLNLGAYPHSPIIIIANIGTTVTGAVDDVPGIRNILDKMQNKPIYTIHMDGALTGFVLPIIKPFGEVVDYFKSIGANTLAFSAHKYPGLSQPCGIVLATRDFYEKAFDKNERSIEYVGNILDITISGSRSGLTVLMFYNALLTLGIDKNNQILMKMVEDNMFLAKLIFEKLKMIYGNEKVNYLHHFNISFPKPSMHLCKKYQLMLTGELATICVLSNVTPILIKEFIIDLQHDKEMAMTNSTTDTKYTLLDLTNEYKDSTIKLFIKTFCEDEPITRHLNIHAMDYEPFATEVVNKAIADGLSKVAVNENKQVIACALAEDMADPFIPNLSNYPKMEPIVGLIDQVSKPFTGGKEFLTGKILHLWIAAVSAEYQGIGLSTKIAMTCIQAASQKGYDYAYAEFTNELSEKVTKQFNVIRLCNRINYDDYVSVSGKKPFSGLKGGTASYIAAIRPGVSLDDLTKVTLSKENAN